ncbi:MAG: transposase [Paracoccaceae bacterium]|nr:transposase [Paracoccaceae bacterium]
MIWDNAAGHCCAAVKIWLSRPKCHIHLIQLPTYCPHLNPIERLWAVLACPCHAQPLLYRSEAVH